MSIHFRVEAHKIIVFGNTYPHKDEIKALGARFNGVDKTWVLARSDQTLERVETLCLEHGGCQLEAPSPVKVDPALRRKVAPTPPPQEVKGLTVSDLMHKVQMTLTEAFSAPVWLVGEVQNVSKKPSGVFLSIAEPKKEASHSSTVTIKATLWQSKLREILSIRGKDLQELLLVDGTQIRLLAQVQLYKDRGHITLNIIDLDPNFTKGALALAREKILRELRQKGLDQANKILPFTLFPFRVGLVSAAGSRAHSDFMDQLCQYNFPGEVVFVSAQMQGEKVVATVTAALEQLQAEGCDVIVITRGGGSAADLRWFDDRSIAYAIAHAKVPIVAAIGHHDDVCIAEEICHMRQKTPTAAADFILHQFELTRRRIGEHAEHIARMLQKRVDWCETVQAKLPALLEQSLDYRWKLENDRLKGFSQKISDAVRERLHTSELELNRLRDDLLYAAGDRHQRIEKTLEKMKQTLVDLARDNMHSARELLLAVEARVKSLDPRPWLAKGWTQLIFTHSAKVDSVDQLSVGDKGKAVLLDGVIDISVEGIRKRGD